MKFEVQKAMPGGWVVVSAPRQRDSSIGPMDKIAG